MSQKTHKTYHGKHINVSFEAARCSHGGNCLRNSPTVFNLKAQPWINLEDCDTSEVIAAVSACPSGALSFQEACDEKVSAQLIKNGPINLRGNLNIKSDFNDAGSNHQRLSLCRCGLSKNKPFCDASHMKSFKDNGHFDKRPAAATQQEAATEVEVICVEDGPLMCRGNVIMQASDGETLTVIDPALCRCGASARKPFCDGTHNKIGFKTTNDVLE